MIMHIPGATNCWVGLISRWREIVDEDDGEALGSITCARYRRVCLRGHRLHFTVEECHQSEPGGGASELVDEVTPV